jgi:N-acylglucosamine-6-phosphate 2-epimerase
MNNKFIGEKSVLDYIKGGLIVSCQARDGWPMYGREIMAAFAMSAETGGAVGIRASKPENIMEIRKKVNLPIIGINKIWVDGYDVYITPTYQSAVDIIKAGCDIVAIDATKRIRPYNETLENLLLELKTNYPDMLLMADISTIEEGINAERLGFDLVSTTLAGYTEYTKDIDEMAIDLIHELSKKVSIPVIAEGRVHTPVEAFQAIESGAYAVVVGTAITRPEVITKWFNEKIKEASRNNE